MIGLYLFILYLYFLVNYSIRSNLYLLCYGYGKKCYGHSRTFRCWNIQRRAQVSERSISGRAWEIIGTFFSTMSSCLNSLSACIYEDFLKPFFPNISESRITFTLRTIVVIFGIFCILMVYIIEHLGGVLEVIFLLFLEKIRLG